MHTSQSLLISRSLGTAALCNGTVGILSILTVRALELEAYIVKLGSLATAVLSTSTVGISSNLMVRMPDTRYCINIYFIDRFDKIIYN